METIRQLRERSPVKQSIMEKFKKAVLELRRERELSGIINRADKIRHLNFPQSRRLSDEDRGSIIKATVYEDSPTMLEVITTRSIDLDTDEQVRVVISWDLYEPTIVEGVTATRTLFSHWGETESSWDISASEEENSLPRRVVFNELGKASSLLSRA